MTTPSNKCCEKCQLFYFRGPFGRHKCSDPNCECHSPTVPTAESERTCKTCGGKPGQLKCPDCVYDAPTPPQKESVETRGWEKELDKVIVERHEQLRGFYDHPFLSGPIKLPDTCPKCQVNLKLFYKDVKHILRSLLSSSSLLTEKRVREEVLKEVLKTLEFRRFSAKMLGKKADAVVLGIEIAEKAVSSLTNNTAREVNKPTTKEREQ